MMISKCNHAEVYSINQMIYELINGEIIDEAEDGNVLKLNDDYKSCGMSLIHICHLPPCGSCCMLLLKLTTLLNGSLLPVFCYSPDRARLLQTVATMERYIL